MTNNRTILSILIVSIYRYFSPILKNILLIFEVNTFCIIVTWNTCDRYLSASVSILISVILVVSCSWFLDILSKWERKSRKKISLKNRQSMCILELSILTPYWSGYIFFHTHSYIRLIYPGGVTKSRTRSVSSTILNISAKIKDF